MSGAWLLGAIGAELVATLSLRASDGLRQRLWLVPVALGYIVAFVCLAFCLQAGMPIGVAYGIWTAVGITAVALLARIIWNEALTKRMIIGIVIIVVGVLLVEIG